MKSERRRSPRLSLSIKIMPVLGLPSLRERQNFFRDQFNSEFRPLRGWEGVHENPLTDH